MLACLLGFEAGLRLLEWLQFYDCVHVFACLFPLSKVPDRGIISYCRYDKKKTSNNVSVHPKGAMLQRHAKICKVKPSSVFALWDIVNYGMYCQYCVINHTT